jgi:hypothetical protein
MERREALKILAMASGSLVALPSWALGWNAKHIGIPSSVFTRAEEALISAVADTIIPEKDSIGALPVGVDRFLIRLLDRCYETDVQNNVKVQLKNLDDATRQAAGIGFTDCSQEQREKLLLTFSESPDENRREFFDLLKSETIRGFRTSQVVMEEYLGYELMPGHYDGNVDVDA